MITCIPGKVMSGKFSSRSSFAEISPTASTARNTITVVTGRLSARLVWRMVSLSPWQVPGSASGADAGAA